MNTDSFIHSWLVCRSLWKKRDLVRVLILAMTLLVSVFPAATRAESESKITSDPFADSQLAAVILAKDRGEDVESKLGAPCVVPASNHETITLVYRAPDAIFLQFVVNVSPSDVNYQLVESMTMSAEPRLPMTCYSASQASQTSLNSGLSKIRTGKGVRLGNSIEQIINLYGEPNEKHVINSQEVRLQYDLGYETDRYYQWTLTFRDGRLMEWTAESVPFFIEVGG